MFCFQVEYAPKLPNLSGTFKASVVKAIDKVDAKAGKALGEDLRTLRGMFRIRDNLVRGAIDPGFTIKLPNGRDIDSGFEILPKERMINHGFGRNHNEDKIFRSNMEINSKISEIVRKIENSSLPEDAKKECIVELEKIRPIDIKKIKPVRLE